MSDEKVIVQSRGGEVRIEAVLNGDEVEFKTYILNSHSREYDLGGQPQHLLNKGGCASYFTVRLQRSLRAKLDSITSLAGKGGRLISELVDDMQT